MKTLLKTFAVSAVAVLAAAPLVSHADQGLTRAQVRAQLVQLEQAGYTPAADWDYPYSLQRAERTLAARNGGDNVPTVTRAQVREDLAQLEKAGYKPGDINYPDSVQHAEQVVAAQKAATDTAYGPAADGNAQAGK